MIWVTFNDVSEIKKKKKASCSVQDEPHLTFLASPDIF